MIFFSKWELKVIMNLKADLVNDFYSIKEKNIDYLTYI